MVAVIDLLGVGGSTPPPGASQPTQVFIDPPLVLQQFEFCMVDKIVFDLKDGKATGCDDLATEHLKLLHPIVNIIPKKNIQFDFEIRFVPTRHLSRISVQGGVR